MVSRRPPGIVTLTRSGGRLGFRRAWQDEAFPNPHYRHRFPAEIISHAIWLYHMFSLSLRDVELILAECGVLLTYETVRRWCYKFGRSFAAKLRKRRPRPGDRWHLDEVFIRIQGRAALSLARAVDQDGAVLVQRRCNAKAAKRFFKRC
jgi:putative transposase